MELQQQFPGLRIEGGPYTPPVWVQHGVKVVRVTQALVGVFFFFGEQILGALGRQPFEFMQETHTNLGAHIAAVYGLNVIADTMKSINAFEIIYNGQVLHSKLSAGGFPEAGALAKKLHEIKAKEKRTEQSS